MKIKSGNDFTLLLTDRGEVYSWGKNNEGQLGIGIMDDYYHEPTMIEFELGIPIRYISVGYYHAAVIDFDYNVYMWGDNKCGQLGSRDNINIIIPTIIECLTEKKIEKIYCADHCTCIITQYGNVYFLGNPNFRIQGVNNNIYIPIKLNPSNTIIKKLCIGDLHMIAIGIDSKIYSWGDNYYNQLCDSDKNRQDTIVIANMLDNLNVKKIICLLSSTIILADDKIYSIGNYNLESIIDKNILTKIIEGVENVWGNDFTVFCKMTNGDIYTWGENGNGQLGIGDNIYRNIPVKINIQLDFKSINSNNGTSYAISASGEIYTWGNNKIVNDNPIFVPTLFTYFIDNGININLPSHTKSARKIDC